MSCCPNCGFSLKPDEIAHRDGWVIDPTGFVEFNGSQLQTTRPQAKLLHALASAAGFLSIDALLYRISGSFDVKVVHVQVSRLRKRLRDNGLPNPIVADRGYATGGYRWRVPVSTQLHPSEVSHV